MTTFKQPPFVENVEEFRANLHLYDEIARNDPDPRWRPSQVSAWYCARNPSAPTQWHFGPSREIGYNYVDYKSREPYYINGGATERHLQGTGWFVAVENTPEAERKIIVFQLEKFLQECLKSRLRDDARINVLQSDLAYVPPQKQGYVFVSYAKKSSRDAEALVEALRGKGYNVWWDNSLEPGDNFSKVIADRIDKASCVIVMWTKYSVESSFVAAEARRALRQSKLICTRDRMVSLEELPLPFGEFQQADPLDINFLVAALRRHGI